MQQLGASFGELIIPPATPTEPLPPLPLEVDDVHIFPDEIHPQQPGVVPIVTGFNVNIRIFLTYSSLSTAEMAFGVDEIFDWDRQQRLFEQSMQRCRQILDSLPDVLKVQSKGTRENIAQVAQPKQPYFPPLPDFDGMRDHSLNDFASAEAQDVRRYEIQKANIYATHLATRSYLVEKYFMLSEKAKARLQNNVQSSPSALSTGMDRFVSHNPADAEALEKTMSEERELVVKDLLVVLGAIDMVNMEPNGDSFVSILCHLIFFTKRTTSVSRARRSSYSARTISARLQAYDLFRHRPRRFARSRAHCSKYRRRGRGALRYSIRITCTSSSTS